MASNKKINNILNKGIIFITTIIIGACTIEYYPDTIPTDETNENIDPTEEIEETDETLNLEKILTQIALGLFLENTNTNETLNLEQIEIEWNNTTNYFTINKEKLKLEQISRYGIHGQENASRLIFLITAKEDIYGKMYAFTYDEDQVRICNVGSDYTSTGELICDHEEGKFPVYFQGANSLTETWQKNEVYRGFVNISNKTRKIKFVFEDEDSIYEEDDFIYEEDEFKFEQQ